jgi:hypothetical protein
MMSIIIRARLLLLRYFGALPRHRKAGVPFSCATDSAVIRCGTE